MAEAQVSFLLDDMLQNIGSSHEQFFGDLLSEIDAVFYPEVLAQTPWDETERFKETPHEHIKKLWRSEVDEAALAVTIGNEAPYATVLDQGHYPGVGPRTVEGDGGIFSQQAPQGIVKPIMSKDALARITRQVAKNMSRLLAKALQGKK